MLLILCFLMGVGNFAMHKAVAESRHPYVEDTKRYFGMHFGKNASYAIELTFLIGALLFAHEGSLLITGFYLVYTLLNVFATWMLLTGRV